jgi:hypothetical protein
MFYVVCAYIVICLSTLIFLPSHIPPERAKKTSIFDNDKSTSKLSDEDIDKIVREHLKDLPDLTSEE